MISIKTKIPPPLVALIFGFLINYTKDIFPKIEIRYEIIFGSFMIIIGLIIILSAIILFKKYQTTITPLNPSFSVPAINLNNTSITFHQFSPTNTSDNTIGFTDEAALYIPPQSNIPDTAYSSTYQSIYLFDARGFKVRDQLAASSVGVIRFFDPSHGHAVGLSDLIFNNIAIGDYRVPSISGAELIAVPTAGTYDIQVPSDFSSGTALHSNSLINGAQYSDMVGDYPWPNSYRVSTPDRYISTLLYLQNRHNVSGRLNGGHYYPGHTSYNSATDLVSDTYGSNSIGDKMVRLPVSQHIGFRRGAMERNIQTIGFYPGGSNNNKFHYMQYGITSSAISGIGQGTSTSSTTPCTWGSMSEVAYGNDPEGYNLGKTGVYSGTITSSAISGITDDAWTQQMQGNVVTDTLGRPTARRIVIRNVPFPVPPAETSGTGYDISISNHASSYSSQGIGAWDGHFRTSRTAGINGSVNLPNTFDTSKRLLYGLVSMYNPYHTNNSPHGWWYYGRMIIQVGGVDYRGNTIMDTIYPEGVEQQGLGPFTNETFTYGQTFFSKINWIHIMREDQQQGSHGNSLVGDCWYWDIVGTVSIGLSEECQAIAYDHPLTTYPAAQANGSTDITLQQLSASGEEHSNFAYGWGTNVWQANGWLGGSGSYSRAWGQPATTSSVVVDPRVYSFDNFGEDLVIAHNNGTPMYWDASTGVGSKAVKIDNTASPTTPQSGGTGTSPATVKSIFVSSPDRHIVCLGAGNPMTVQWASQETTNVWTVNDPNNTAGSQVLTGGTYLIGWAKVRGQTLIFSDNNVTGMVFQGPPYTFGFKELGNNCGLISPQGAITVQGRCYWMGFKNFFVFDGGVKVLPSPVAKFVFEDFNYAEQFKVISGTSKGYNEIWWFYPSLSTNSETTSTNAASQNREINRYVKYNYIENLWDVGTFSRTAWVGGSIFENDLACDANRYIYKHDVGTTDDGSPFNAFVESADFDIDDGQNIMLVDKALPDATSTDKQGGTYDETYKITFSSRKDSIGDYTNKGPFTVRNRDVTIDGVNYLKTGRINPRVRGRQMKIKVESDGLHDHWRLGDLRLDMKPDGER